MERASRRISYAFLCLIPFLDIPLVTIRALRIPGLHHGLGTVLFAAIGLAAWTLRARRDGAGTDGAGRLTLAGTLLLGPFALMALLWIGVGPPWTATPIENQMRYFVLGIMTITVSSGFVTLRDAVRAAGERFFSTVGFAAILLAGPLYLVWSAWMFGPYSTDGSAEKLPQAVLSLLSRTLDLLLFHAGALTYVACAAFAASLGRVGWLGRSVARLYVFANLLALACLFARGWKFPDPAALSTPWYTRPGFVAGIPAVPWIMPYFLGVIVLRRAGDRPRTSREVRNGVYDPS